MPKLSNATVRLKICTSLLHSVKNSKTILYVRWVACSNTRLIGKICLCQHFYKMILHFIYFFEVKCPVSCAKNGFNFTEHRLIWQHFITKCMSSIWHKKKLKYCFASENNVPPKLNLTLSLSNGVSNSKRDLKFICCRNNAILASTNPWINLSLLMIYRIHNWVLSIKSAVPGMLSSKFTMSKKPYKSAMQMWQLLYKSCTMQKAFWGHHNTVLWKNCTK